MAVTCWWSGLSGQICQPGMVYSSLGNDGGPRGTSTEEAIRFTRFRFTGFSFWRFFWALSEAARRTRPVDDDFRGGGGVGGDELSIGSDSTSEKLLKYFIRFCFPEFLHSPYFWFRRRIVLNDYIFCILTRRFCLFIINWRAALLIRFSHSRIRLFCGSWKNWTWNLALSRSKKLSERWTSLLIASLKWKT